jgi:hypothetical protein
VEVADYTQCWREKTQATRNHAAETWSGLLAWELANASAKMVVVMSNQTAHLLDHLVSTGRIRLPRREQIMHYAYIGQRARSS